MRSKWLLDTSILIGFWRHSRKRLRGDLTPEVAQDWAKRLITLRKTNVIVTPVYVEVIAGVTNRDELRATQAFLAEFRCIDNAVISPADWQETIRMAQRVPRDSKPRQLGDCLIRAIADRLNYEVATVDSGFPR
jgi:predicted nucleic acid-binding protein